MAAQITTETEASLSSTETPDRARSGKTFAEILAPVHEEFRASGMTDEELGEFVDSIVAEVRASRRACDDLEDVELREQPELVLP